MAVTLKTIVDSYLDDKAFQDRWRDTSTMRDGSIPEFNTAIDLFVSGNATLAEFRALINQAHSQYHWGAGGTGFMMELNKLAKYHGAPAEAMLRQLLDGINSTNLGERIELFHAFLIQEKERLKQTIKSGTMNPGNSALMLSLFAVWSASSQDPIIYYSSFKKGIRMLLDAGLLPTAVGLRKSYDSIEVRMSADHRAVEQTVAQLAATEPRLKRSGKYWSEGFLLWLWENAEIFDAEPEPDATGATSTVTTITHAPLAAVAPALLERLIGEVRRRLLIDAEQVRQIYYALLAGNVILTGPPGTGKTELARLLPELLWQTEEAAGSSADPFGNPVASQLNTSSAYTTALITATDDWSVRTLIGGLAPQAEGGQVSYKTSYGHLTRTILENWAVSEGSPDGWQSSSRVSVRGTSVVDGEQREFRGRWLVIDEFNRAQIDVALGEALTALSGGAALRVPTDGGSAELPLPSDFRIIGTLNSFDRNFLNHMSEALKRRFAFIEILPPGRHRRADEQTIVLRKALGSVAHLSDSLSSSPESILWSGVLHITDRQNVASLAWGEHGNAFRAAFEAAWRAFEIIRIYRQLGTAQAISMLRHALIAGVIEQHSTVERWAAAFDMALTDTLADQLQVLLPDELDALMLALSPSVDEGAFGERYNRQLENLSERRRMAQLGALANIVGEAGAPLIGDAELEALAESEQPIPEAVLKAAFHLGTERLPLPRFTRRLRSFKAERSL